MKRQHHYSNESASADSDTIYICLGCGAATDDGVCYTCMADHNYDDYMREVYNQGSTARH